MGDVVPMDDRQSAVAEVAPFAASGSVEIATGLTASLKQCAALADMLAGCTTMPKHLKDPGDVMCAILTAAQLRLPLMAVVRGMHMIEGKATLGADLMLAAVRASGTLTSWHEEATNDGCTITATRGNEQQTVAFLKADAERAGLTKKDVWSKYPRAMYRARAVSAICRAMWPDILAGHYDPDEVEPMLPADHAYVPEPTMHVDAATGEIMDAEFEQPTAPPAPVQPKSSKARAYEMVQEAIDAIKVAHNLGELMEAAAELEKLVNAAMKHKHIAPDAELAIEAERALGVARERMELLSDEADEGE